MLQDAVMYCTVCATMYNSLEVMSCISYRCRSLLPVSHSKLLGGSRGGRRLSVPTANRRWFPCMPFLQPKCRAVQAGRQGSNRLL